MNNTAKNICTHGEPLRAKPRLVVLQAYDPTHTTTLRAQFAAEAARRFRNMRGLIRKAIIDRDCFGLVNPTPDFGVFALPNHREFNFVRSGDKVEAFMEWLLQQQDLTILEITQIGQGIESAWTNKYIESAYQKGIVRARNELRKAGYTTADGALIPALETAGAVQVAFNQPFHIDRAGLLYSRVYSDLKGITSAMDTQISRVLSQGIADGVHPRDLARLLTKTISGPLGDLAIRDSLGKITMSAERRAKILARTEIIRAHHQATIQEYKNWGAEGVKVKAEWTTAGDGRVCERCASREGRVYTLKEIENKIPLHPQCRCIALPVDVTDEKEY